MYKARYLVEAHVLEGRSVAELAAAHGVHRSWIYKLLARYREGGLEALESRSRRPRSSPASVSADVEQAILRRRRELQSASCHRRRISTFSCDTAYSASPTALRASARLKNSSP